MSRVSIEDLASSPYGLMLGHDASSRIDDVEHVKHNFVVILALHEAATDGMMSHAVTCNCVPIGLLNGLLCIFYSSYMRRFSHADLV